MNTSSSVLTLRVIEARALNPLIKLLRLCADDGILPGYEAGANVRVQVELAGGVKDWRDYSLINWQRTPGATRAPANYSTCTSRFMKDSCSPSSHPKTTSCCTPALARRFYWQAGLASRR